MFRYSICDPLKKDPIEMGEIESNKIMDILERFPWRELLDKMKGVKESEIHYSPSIEFENKSNGHGLSISILETNGRQEFYIFYKRPKLIKRFFGLVKSVDDNYLSDRTGQNKNDVNDAVKALVNDDLVTLESRWG